MATTEARAKICVGGVLKVLYDFLLLMQFRALRPPVER